VIGRLDWIAKGKANESSTLAHHQNVQNGIAFLIRQIWISAGTQQLLVQMTILSAGRPAMRIFAHVTIAVYRIQFDWLQSMVGMNGEALGALTDIEEGAGRSLIDIHPHLKENLGHILVTISDGQVQRRHSEVRVAEHHVLSDERMNLKQKQRNLSALGIVTDQKDVKQSLAMFASSVRSPASVRFRKRQNELVQCDLHEVVKRILTFVSQNVQQKTVTEVVGKSIQFTNREFATFRPGRTVRLRSIELEQAWNAHLLHTFHFIRTAKEQRWYLQISDKLKTKLETYKTTKGRRSNDALWLGTESETFAVNY
jgi:hypothetical protein